MAGYKAVSESKGIPLTYYHNNLISTLVLLKLMKQYDVTRIIFSSSATVYGNSCKEGFEETDRTGIGITNPYGRTKYMIEEILKDEARSNPGLSVTILRYFNPIGAHLSGLLGEDPNGIPNNLMPVIFQVYQNKLQTLQIFGNDYPTPDGTCIRDFIHVVDLATGHLKALEHMSPGTEILNLGCGKGTSVMEIIKMFEEISNVTLPKQIIGRREGDLPTVFANPHKAQEKLNWTCQLTIEDAIRNTLQYNRNNIIKEGTNLTE